VVITIELARVAIAIYGYGSVVGVCANNKVSGAVVAYEYQDMPVCGNVFPVATTSSTDASA
jgi:hypothetical protein